MRSCRNSDWAEPYVKLFVLMKFFILIMRAELGNALLCWDSKVLTAHFVGRKGKHDVIHIEEFHIQVSLDGYRNPLHVYIDICTVKPLSFCTPNLSSAIRVRQVKTTFILQKNRCPLRTPCGKTKWFIFIFNLKQFGYGFSWRVEDYTSRGHSEPYVIHGKFSSCLYCFERWS